MEHIIWNEMELKAQADKTTQKIQPKVQQAATVDDLDNLIGTLTTAANNYLFPHNVKDMTVEQKMDLVQRVQALRKVLERLDTTAFNMEDKLDPLHQAQTEGVQFYNYYEGCKTPYPLTMGQYVDLMRKNTIGVSPANVDNWKQDYRKLVRNHRNQNATRLVTVAVRYILSESNSTKLCVFGAAIVPLDTGLTRTQAKLEGRLGAYDRLRTNALAVFVGINHNKYRKTLRKAVHTLGCFYSDKAYAGSDSSFPDIDVPEHERINPHLPNRELCAKAWNWSAQQ